MSCWPWLRTEAGVEVTEHSSQSRAGAVGSFPVSAGSGLAPGLHGGCSVTAASHLLPFQPPFLWPRLPFALGNALQSLYSVSPNIMFICVGQ